MSNCHKKHRTEPAEMTVLRAQVWYTVEDDVCGPFPNRRHALVLTDQYSRYPEVDFLSSKAFKPTRKKLKKIFATYRIPKKLQTYNGPPFNSEMRFYHINIITPKHPKAQGQVENFNPFSASQLSTANFSLYNTYKI